MRRIASRGSRLHLACGGFLTRLMTRRGAWFPSLCRAGLGLLGGRRGCLYLSLISVYLETQAAWVGISSWQTCCGVFLLRRYASVTVFAQQYSHVSSRCNTSFSARTMHCDKKVPDCFLTACYQTCFNERGAFKSLSFLLSRNPARLGLGI